MPVQLAGNVRRGGLFEIGFGITLGELVEVIGGGSASGLPVRAVQVGGPLGAYFPPSMFHLPFDYDAFARSEEHTSELQSLMRISFSVFCLNKTNSSFEQ